MNMKDQSLKSLIFVGAGGHAKVLLALVRALGLSVEAVCDPVLVKNGIKSWQGVPVLSDDCVVDEYSRIDHGLVLAVGQSAGQKSRSLLFELYTSKGFVFPCIIHPKAWVAPDVQLSPGVQIMAGAIVQPGCSIGCNSIINTMSSVDHDCIVGNHVHIAPGAVLCGSVRVGDHAFIGSGSVVVQGMQIGESALVGAGTTVYRELAPKTKVIGAKVSYHRLSEH